MGGRADRRTGGQRRAGAQTGERGGRQADELADWRTGGWADGGERVDDGFPTVKLLI